MDCASCARKIETALTRVLGVSDIAISTTTETLRLRAAEPRTGERVEKVIFVISVTASVSSAREPSPTTAPTPLPGGSLPRGG